MNFREYQVESAKFRNMDLGRNDAVLMCSLGLASETGEIAEEVKHSIYHGHKLDRDNLEKELGDLLWYLTNFATEYEMSLDDIAEKNIAKLTKRYPNGFSSEASINREERLPKILTWDRPGGVYGEGVRLCELDAKGNILHARVPTEAEKIAIEMGHIPEKFNK